ncbi:FHA domain-containing protein [Dactylosporangium aurantiacum]|uniref:FHA domain-containing protein n=1 Tax=Dactylosporangium aurantiacum TaxID=35754 RepID=A0A9Q9I849_9ACTN|nr:FHA domain-containing protein [Dactylosporangium aurantiacum]MDG6107185.1 FHA domain-containing protein [Dactylosporangium aurantiacum]UWZ51479.1 FHA domain-containing protein [Dactylosporangium aurantiacum]
MAACPKGHESETTDYCDVCGAAMAAARQPDPPAAAGPAAAPAPARPAVCPECGTPMTGRFCEVDGFDALAVPAPPKDVPAAPPEVTASSADLTTPPEVTAASADLTTPPDVVTPPGAVPAPPGETAATGWHAVVTADRAHFDRVEAWNGPDPTIAFPRFCPVRRFPLTGEQVLIGRRSRSRGSYPDIDLAGPPEDAAVSHLHALLVAQPGGGWAVVDLRSANATFVNGADEPIQPELPVVLADGDHINVGSFTRITVHATPL